MKASVHAYDLGLREAWRGVRRRQGFLVRIEEGGNVGWGEAAPAPDASTSARRRLEADLRGSIAGASVGRLLPEARHALTTAGLDIAARRESRPLWRMFSPHAPESVPVNAVLPVLPVGASVRAARRLVREGYGTLKLKIAAAASEPRRVLAIREAVGPRIALRVDPNASWSLAAARRRLDDLAPAGVEYVEQPVRRPRDLEALAANSPVPIAPDESMEDAAQARRWLRDGTFRCAVLKPALVGGLDQVRDLIAEARRSGTRLTITDRLESAVGRMAAVHAAFLLPAAVAACGLGGGRWFAEDTSELPDIGPVAARPTGPGLGVSPSNVMGAP